MTRPSTLRSYVQRVLAKAASKGRRTTTRKSYSLTLEALEDRLTPSGGAVYQVTGLGDSQADNSAAVVDTNHAGTLADPYLAPSLRSAVLAANAAGGASLIEFAPALTAGAPAAVNLGIDGDDTFGPSALYITSNITIQGPTDNHGITLARDTVAAPTRLRLFDVAQTGSLTVDDLTLSGGLAQGGNATVDGGGGAGMGGAIVNQGRLDLFQDTLTGNQAIGGDGAGSLNTDTLPGTGGGGLGGDAGASQAGGPNGGSGTGPANGGFGGGGWDGGSGGFGGGGSAGTNGGFGGGSAENGGEGLGGALFNFGGTVFITDSTFYNNTALGGHNAGLIAFPLIIVLGAPQPDYFHAPSFGGAVYNLNGAVTVTNSTLAFNTVSVTPSTLVSSATVDAGGAIYDFGSAGEATQAGPTLPAQQATVVLDNSILSNSLLVSTTAFGADDFDANGNTSVTGTNDIVQNSTGTATLGNHDPDAPSTIEMLDPGLGAFGNYGGPTSVLPLLTTSFGVDAGNNSLAVDPANGNAPLTTDQRGFPRFLSGNPNPGSPATVDLGAFEYHLPPSVSPVAPLSGFAFTPLSNVTVATFTYDNGTEPPAAFNAVIDWGDGTTSTGTVVQSGTTYLVQGTHTYTQSSPPVEGAYDIQTTVQFNGTSAFAFTSADILVELLPDGSRGTAEQRFVAQVYRDLLQREVDPGGLASWTGVLDRLQAAGVSLSSAEQTVVYDIETNPSHEYYIDLVHSFYEQYLRRQEGASDAAGFAADVALLAFGAATYPGQLVYAETQVRMNFLLSPEYLAKQGGTNTGFIQGLYVDNLGRSATTDEGAAAFLTQLTQGTITQAQVALDILLGTEFETDQVTGWYRQFFQRPTGAADMPHIQFLVQQLQAGVPEVNVIAGLIGDQGQEFYNLVEGPQLVF
jgi:hypothetical protein